MTIKEVCKKYNISADTLRYYEKVGMIPRVNRNDKGIRDYTPEDCSWVELVLCMRAAGLPINSIVEYINLTQQGDSTVHARLKLLEDQREQLYLQQKQINETIERLNHKIDHYKKCIGE